jgi:hypothetical protein
VLTLLLLLAQDAPVEPAPAVPTPCGALIDLRRLEAGVLAGAAVFSGDFEADPTAAGAAYLRAPLPWLSRYVLGFDCDILGAFAQAGAARLDRDLDPAPRVSDDTILLAAAGLEVSLVPEEAWRLRLQGGAGYVDFGDVEGVDSGAAGLLGLNAGAALGGGLWLSAVTQAYLGGEDEIFTLSLGLSLSF